MLMQWDKFQDVTLTGELCCLVAARDARSSAPRVRPSAHNSPL